MEHIDCLSHVGRIVDDIPGAKEGAGADRPCEDQAPEKESQPRVLHQGPRLGSASDASAAWRGPKRTPPYVPAG